MKMLFSSPKTSEVKGLRKKLFESGIRCEVRFNPVAHGVFGIPAQPELWVEDSHVIEALKMLGPQRLGQMTVIFSKP